MICEKNKIKSNTLLILEASRDLPASCRVGQMRFYQFFISTSAVSA